MRPWFHNAALLADHRGPKPAQRGIIHRRFSVKCLITKQARLFLDTGDIVLAGNMSGEISGLAKFSGGQSRSRNRDAGHASTHASIHPRSGFFLRVSVKKNLG